MAEARVILIVDGKRHEVPASSTLAAALLDVGVTAFRRSVDGEPRVPLCGMGTCHECSVTVSHW